MADASSSGSGLPGLDVPNLSLASSAKSQTSTGVTVGGSTGPSIDLGSTGLSSSTILLLVAGAALLIFVWRRQ